MTIWDTSCTDWASRIQSGQSLCPTLPLAEAEADRAVAIFNLLRLPDVPGTPTLAEAGGTWFVEIVRALFGSWDSNQMFRHIRELFILCPKKSSKTTYAAALLLTAVIMSPRPRAEFLFIGPTQAVSDLAFRQAAGMVLLDPVLTKKFLIQEHLKTITYRPTGANLKVKSFDPRVLTGVKPSGVLIDELHVIGEMNNADRVLGQLRGGLISQPEAFLINITTQSERPPSGVFKSELMKARRVRDGETKAPILPILYEFPPGVAWRDPANWWMVTPNRGKSVEVERLVTDFDQAVTAGEEELRRWASQHLNVEIGLALRSDRWTGADFWERQARPGIGLTELLSRCEVVTVGLDGGGLDDILGLAAVGRCKQTGQWLLWTHGWLHPIGLDRRKSEASKYHDFASDGDLDIVEGLPDDVTQLAEIVKRIHDSGLLAKIGMDPEKTHKVMLAALVAAGIPEDLVIGISQGWKLVGAITVAERMLADGTLIHGGQPMMNWCVGNARIVPVGNAVSITKQASGTGKIDPLMAAFNAITLMALNPQKEEKSFWETMEAAA